MSDDDEFRGEVCRRLAQAVIQRLPELPIGVDQVEKLIYSNLSDELFEYDLTQRSPQKEFGEIRDQIFRSALGFLAHLGESIDELAAEGKTERRIVNAAIKAAADTEDELRELLAVGPRAWDPTAPIERRTREIVAMHRTQFYVFIFLSVAGIGALGTAVWLSWLSWIAGVVVGVFWIIGVRSGTRYIDIHDHR